MKTALRTFVSAVLVALVSLPAAAQDVKAGERNAAMCIGCHGIPGYQASFPEVHKVPMIAGQNAKYIIAALNAYKKGDRRHPTMRSIALGLTDQEMADLAAFYEQQAGVPPVTEAPPAPPAEVAALLQRANCASCHGANFNKPIDPSYPKLAGQHADYLYVALKSYQGGGNTAVVGRNNAIMGGLAKQYTHAELKVLSRYLASLPGELRTVQQPRFRSPSPATAP